MKISDKTRKSFRAVDVGELVERIQKGLDAARRMGVLSGTMIREGDDGPMIIKMGSRPVVVRDLSVDDLRAAAEAAGIPWEDGYEARVVEVWASDERVDRDGDIIEQSWNFDNYAKNPLVLWGHEWGAPPIGNSIMWGVENRKDDDYEGPALRLTELFAPGDASPQAESVLRLAKAGFLRSGSVGFYPGQVVTADSDEAREELGLPEGGYLLRDNELIEHSHCSVPANPGAMNILAAAKAAGGLAPTDIAAIRELARQDALIVGREDVWARFDSALRRVWRELYPEVAIEDHASVAHPVEPDSAVERSHAPASKSADAGDPITRDEALKPYPGEHACRLADPDRFSEFRRANEDREVDGKRVDVIYGHVKDSEDWEEQAFRYPKDVWTEAAARANCDEHDGIAFEPAAEDEGAADGRTTEERLDALTESVARLDKSVGDLATELADIKSDADAASRESEQESSAAVSALLGDLRENAEKVLASDKGTG